MAEFTVKYNGSPIDFVSLSYRESLDPNPQPFSLVLAGVNYNIAEMDKVEIYRGGTLVYTGYVEEANPSRTEQGEVTIINGSDASIKALQKVIGPDDFIGGEPAYLIRAINQPNSPLAKKDPVTKQLLWTATASANSSDAIKAVDGDPYTPWKKGSNQANGDWLKIDLGEVKSNLCRVTVEHVADEYAENLVIEYSTNDLTYYTLGTFTNNQIKNIDVTTYNYFNARYIKLRITANASRPWSVNEVWVYYKTGDPIFQEGQLDTYGYGVYGQLGNFELRLSKWKRIADYIGWDVWVSPDEKLYFKQNRGQNLSDSVILKVGVNAKMIDYSKDYRERYDKITVLGSGEGKAQLSYTVTIDNPPSNPKEGLFRETDITDLETLMKRAQVLLDKLKNPKTSIKVEVVAPKFDAHAGDTIKIQDDKLGINETIRIWSVERSFSSEGETAVLELGEAREDITTRQAEIASAIKTLEQYYGGIPTSFQYGWADNVGPGYPIVARVKIPYECREVNYVKIDVFGEKFRTYSTGAASGGGTALTSSSETPLHTHNVSIPSHQHDVAIGTKTSGPSSTTGTYYLPDSWESATVAAGSHSHGVAGYTDYANPDTPHRHGISSTLTKTYNFIAITGLAARVLPTDSHTHSVNVGTVTSNAGGGTTVTSASGGGVHSHSVSIPNHTHSIVYGIFEGGYPGTISLEVIIPSGGTVSYGALGTGALSLTEKDLSRAFTGPGVYTVKLYSTALGRIRFNLYGQMFLGARIP